MIKALCQDCNKDQGEYDDPPRCVHCGSINLKRFESTGDPNQYSPSSTKNSNVWYLLPIFFSLIGGLIMYFVLRDTNKRMAKKGLIVGVILTVVPFLIAIIAGLSTAAMYYI